MLAGDALGLRQGQQRDAGAAERLAAGELDDAGDRVAPRGEPCPATTICWPSFRCVALGGRLVDRDLVGAARAEALRQRLKVSKRARQHGGDERGRAAVVSRLPAVVEQRRLREDLPDGRRHAGHRAHAARASLR